jgi:hypothetical protein
VGSDLLQKLNILAKYRGIKMGKASDVRARAGQAWDETSDHWIDDLSENNWYSVSLTKNGENILGRLSYDHIGTQTDQFFRECLHAPNVAASPAICEFHVSTFMPAKLNHGLLKNCHKGTVLSFDARH